MAERTFEVRLPNTLPPTVLVSATRVEREDGGIFFFDARLMLVDGFARGYWDRVRVIDPAPEQASPGLDTHPRPV